LKKTKSFGQNHRYTCHVKIVLKVLFQKHPPIGPIGGGLTFWISGTNSDQNVIKQFLANILVIWDGPCNLFGSLSVSGRKKGGVKKKLEKICVFLCFF
jgi:hypothetical protein